MSEIHERAREREREGEGGRERSERGLIASSILMTSYTHNPSII
jgi:hypothetical protein